MKFQHYLTKDAIEFATYVAIATAVGFGVSHLTDDKAISYGAGLITGVTADRISRALAKRYQDSVVPQMFSDEEKDRFLDDFQRFHAGKMTVDQIYKRHPKLFKIYNEVENDIKE